MFLAVYLISIRILLSNGSLFNSPGHMFMFGTTTLIFILATAAIVIGPALASQGIPMFIKMIDSSFTIGWSPHKVNVATGVLATIIKLNARILQPILSDIVCAWRAIAVWKYDRRVVAILCTCVLGTCLALVYDLKLALKSSPGSQGEGNIEEAKVALIVVGPMLATNILSTLLIAWKAWELRRTMGMRFKEGSPSERIETVLALLVESGFLYCLLWVITFPTALGRPTLNGVHPPQIFYLFSALTFFRSTYPALIIIIVCMQIGQDAYTTKPDRSEALDLTTIRLPIGDNTFDSQMPAASDEGKASARFTSPEW
ncbi:hypothetical protein BGW80DRAFT_1279084 [Lactifluus volemus]|nr:hypothetical protein BGW80DRAFT_1279084 [Lactifluus volemus]